MLPSNCTGKVNGKAPLLDQAGRSSLNWGDLVWKRQGLREEKKPMVFWILLDFPCILETEDAAAEIAKGRAFLCIIYYNVSSRKLNPSAGYALRDVKKRMLSHQWFSLQILLPTEFLPQKENLDPVHCHSNTEPKPLQPRKDSLPPLNHTEAIKDATTSCQQYLLHLPDDKLKAHRIPVNWDMYFSAEDS